VITYADFSHQTQVRNETLSLVLLSTAVEV